tara:strand:- start:85 stop:834 length:750 start_codon:yes stop_codon:yes gene_type:complete
VIFDKLETQRNLKGTQVLALIDPDVKNDNIFPQIIDTVNKSNFDGLLVGGSRIVDDNFNKRLLFIKENTDLPIILFPGDSSQISDNAEAILFLSLLSGRNPKYLIEEQVISARRINDFNIEVIPTGYLLLKTEKKSAVELISNTTPLDMNNTNNVIDHCLAAQYMGNKLLFLECGSNSDSSVELSLLKQIKNKITIPLMVGGGIKNKEMALNLAESGASYLVIGSLIEQTLDFNITLDINQSVRGLYVS